MHLNITATRKPWPNGLANRHNWTQVYKTKRCVGACNGWPNGFVSRLVSRKTQEISFTVSADDLRSSLRRLVFDCQRVKNMRADLSSTKFISSCHKSAQVCGQNERTCDPIWPGLKNVWNSNKENSIWAYLNRTVEKHYTAKIRLWHTKLEIYSAIRGLNTLPPMYRGLSLDTFKWNGGDVRNRS